MAKVRRRPNFLFEGDEVSINIGLTVQVGERNFVKVDVGGRTTVQVGETGDAAHQRLFEHCEDLLGKKVDEYAKEMS